MSFDNYNRLIQLTVELKTLLDFGIPAIIGGNKEKGNINKDHFALVVSYLNDGTKESDFIVLDPWHEKNTITTLADFYSNDWYPYPAIQFGNMYCLVRYE